jgi:hypothetical protein
MYVCLDVPMRTMTVMRAGIQVLCPVSAFMGTGVKKPEDITGGTGRGPEKPFVDVPGKPAWVPPAPLAQARQRPSCIQY